MIEIWKPIKYNKNYAISNFGRIKSYCRNSERLLRLSYTKDGYVKCGLCINGKSLRFRVSRLVAEHFIPNPDNKETVNHIDGNKKNNRADNLEWATKSEQMIHAYEKGLKKPMQGTDQKRAKLTTNDVRYIRRVYKPRDVKYGMKALAKQFNVSECCIKRVVKGITYFNIE